MSEYFKNLPDNCVLDESNNVLILDIPGYLLSPAKNLIGQIRKEAFIVDDITTDVELDDFDSYYNHLLIINKKADDIIGYARFAVNREVFPQYGSKGFYFCTLYDVDNKFFHATDDAAEMDRILITPTYQRKPLSLALLWHGIALFLAKNEAKRLYGLLSIRNSYQPLSIDLLVNYLKINYMELELGKFITPHYPLREKAEELKTHLEAIGDDLNKLKMAVRQVEKGVRDIPPLYMCFQGWSNVKFLAAGNDPTSFNCTDVVIIGRPTLKAFEVFNKRFSDVQL